MKKRTGVARRSWGFGVALGVVVLLGTLTTLDGSEPATPSKVASASAGLSADSVPLSVPSRVDYARLEGRIELLMRHPDMVGLAVGAVENGRVRFVKGYGEVLAGSGAPVTPDTVFRWGSVSKGIASALVTKLAADGRLSLNAPVAGLGTTLRLPGESEGVTVVDVLSHRVGLVRNAWDDRLEAGENPRALRAAFGELTPLCPPATCHAYQNIAYDTATEVVERATGRAYAAVAQDRLFTPLGMRSASMSRAGLQAAASWARPHHLARTPAVVNDVYYRVPAASGVNSSISDLVRWMRAQIGAAPPVLSPSALATMHSARVFTPPRGRRSAMDRALTDPAYGLGWRSFIYAGRRLVGHRGTVDGYGALVLFDPADRSGIAMLWNSNQHCAARLQLEFFDMLYGLPPTDWLELQPLTPEPGAVALRPAPLASYAGPSAVAASHPLRR